MWHGYYAIQKSEKGNLFIDRLSEQSHMQFLFFFKQQKCQICEYTRQPQYKVDATSFFLFSK